MRWFVKPVYVGSSPIDHPSPYSTVIEHILGKNEVVSLILTKGFELSNISR